MPMKCPVCRELLIVIERNEIEIDYCVTCEGAWFDAQELNLLLDPLVPASGEGGVEGTLRPAGEVSEKPRPCPLCDRKMQKVHIGSEPEILIDRCPEGDGLWFDGREVGAFLKQLRPAQGSREERVLGHLAEVFGSEPSA